MIMELLARSGAPLSLTGISHALDISRSTTHAILSTLADRRWVIRDAETGEYTWGPAISALVRAAGDRPMRAQLHDLHVAAGIPAFLARRDGDGVTVIDRVGDSQLGTPVQIGFRMPLIAPFGRDFVAWAGDREQQAWLDRIAPADPLRERLVAVLAEVRRRGVVIERLSREYVRVYSALTAFDSSDAADPITARLAGAFADLTLVDFLPEELDARRSLPVATVSAPVFDRVGVVVMSVSTAPFTDLSASALRVLSEQVRAAAAQVQEMLP